MEEKTIIGYCAVSGEPIYNGEAYVEVAGKLYMPEHYEPKQRTLLDRILRR